MFAPTYQKLCNPFTIDVSWAAFIKFIVSRLVNISNKKLYKFMIATIKNINKENNKVTLIRIFYHTTKSN